MTDWAKKKVVHGGGGKQQREKTKKKVLDFSASLNPLPPQVSWNCDQFFLEHYPDDNYTQLKETIANTFHRKSEEICVGNGSIELIRVFCDIVFQELETFYVESPTFGEYEYSANLNGAKKVGKIDEADVCFICNPNNPTGILRSRHEMLNLIEIIDSHKGIFCADEAFIELADPIQSLVNLPIDSVLVLRSLTKSFSVPGIRFGYGFGEPNFIEKMEAMRPPWSVNAYAEAFALQAFHRYQDLEQSRELIERERVWLTDHLKALDLYVDPSSANFLLVQTKQKVDQLCKKLEKIDILVRDCSSFGLPSSIRIAVRTRDENRILLEALSACLR